MVAFALLLTSTLGARWNEVAANGSWPQPRYSHSAVIVGSGADETLRFWKVWNDDAAAARAAPRESVFSSPVSTIR